MKNKRNYKALITIGCFLAGTPMPPKLAREIVYVSALIIMDEEFIRKAS